MKMAELDPGNVNLKMRLAALYTSLKYWEKALEWVQKAQRLQPENVEIQNAIASLYLEMGKPERSQDLIKEVRNRDLS